MTVAVETNKTAYDCDGILVEFDFSFKIFEEGDLKVTITDSDDNDTVLALTTDYTVSGSLEEGGKVTTVATWGAGNTITLELDMDFEQPTDLIYGGCYSSEAVETMVDRTVKMIQQLKVAINEIECGSGGGVISDAAYSGAWNGVVNVGASKNALWDKLNAYGSAASRDAEDVMTDGADLPDGHAIKTYGDAHWLTLSGATTANEILTLLKTVDGTGSGLDADLIDGFSPGSAFVRDAEDTLTDGSKLPDGHAIITYGDANWGYYTNLTEFVAQTAWRLFYSNADGDVTELALGTSGQYLKANGVSAIPTWDTPSGAGDVVGPATHAADYVPQWDGTPNSKTLVEGFAITAAGKAILDDADAAAQRTTLGLGTAATRAAEDALTDGANLPDGAAIKAYGDTNWGGYTNLTSFIAQTAWRLFYSNADGDVIELALGTSGQYLKANGVAAVPTWAVPSGAGDVIGPATNTDGYIPIWNGANSKTLANGVANNSTNWNTAHGWGNHASAGYLTTLSGHNVTELDDVTNAGSGIIISGVERTKLTGIEASATADQTKADIDALGLSHDSLVDVSANDHHAEVHSIASHGDTSATGAELDTLTDNSIADALHRHSELVASDGSPDPALSVDASGIVGAGTASPTIGNNFAGGSDDGTVLKINHGNSGAPTSDTNSPLWVKRYYNYVGTAWNAGAAYFGAVKTAGQGSLHTVQIDTYCSGGTVPVVSGVLGSLLSHLKNDSVVGSGEDIHNMHVITYTPEDAYNSVHIGIMVDMNNRWQSDGWKWDYEDGYTCGVRVANESLLGKNDSCGFSVGGTSAAGKWYTGLFIGDIAYDSDLYKGEGIYFENTSVGAANAKFDEHADCLRAGGKLTMRAGDDIEFYYDTDNWVIWRTGRQNSYTDRMHLTQTGNLVVTGTVAGSNLSGSNTGDQSLAGYLQNLSEDSSPSLGGDLACGSYDIDLNDSTYIRLGNSDDLRLYHSGNINFISAYNGRTTYFYNGANSEYMVKLVPNAEVALYYNGLLKFKTTSGGICYYGTAGTCDYVFEDGYKMLTLDEFGAYIKKNKQLPNFTLGGGDGSVEIETMRKQLSEKIEEQALYILELHERVKRLEA